MDKTIAQVPLVSVLMPVYNAEKYLKESIESILNQTYTNFEFLIINDGSTDRSEKVILSYIDERIKYFKNEKNLKIVKTLNRGLKICQGKYIIRMDADDISLPRRIEKQVKYMELHPNIGVSGFNIKHIGNSKILNQIWKVNTNARQLKVNLLTHSVIPHPSAIIRKKLLDTFSIKYREKFLYAEDYFFWVEISRISELGNINEVLLHYRHHESNTESNYSKEQLLNHKHIIKYQLEKLLGMNISKDLTFLLIDNKIQKLLPCLLVCSKLVVQNYRNKIYHTPTLVLFLIKKIMVLFFHRRNSPVPST